MLVCAERSPIGPKDAFHGKQQTLRHFLGLGISFLPRCSAFADGTSRPSAKTLKTVYYPAAAPSIDPANLAWPGTIFVPACGSSHRLHDVLRDGGAVHRSGSMSRPHRVCVAVFRSRSRRLFVPLCALLCCSSTLSGLFRHGLAFCILQLYLTYVIISITHYRHMSITKMKNPLLRSGSTDYAL
jgi:hypothetical protein